MPKLALLAVVILLAGCYHRFSSEMDRWVGKPEAELIAALGAPVRTADLGNGQRVLTWVDSYNASQPGERVVMAECVRSFTVSASTIASWSARGCQRLVVGK
jgi:hypothetical protein